MTEPEQRNRRPATIRARNQISMAADALQSAGLEVGDRVAEWAGALTGVYRSGELDDLRDEWH